jgi:hypothetical protein
MEDYRNPGPHRMKTRSARSLDGDARSFARVTGNDLSGKAGRNFLQPEMA